MELDLEKAFDGPVALSHRFDIPPSVLDRPELLSLGPVDFRGDLMRADPGFVLTATLGFQGTVACSRCLAPVSFDVTEPVSWVFAPTHRRSDGEELQTGDLDVVYYSELSFPFTPFIEEEVQLEIPLKALCRDDCKGLCPTCGADRNAAACGCTTPEDARWAGLKGLAAEKPRA